MVGRVAIGATIGVLLGIAFAFAVGLWKANDAIVDPILQIADYFPHHRRMRRATILGDRPV